MARNLAHRRPLFFLIALEFAWCAYLALARVVPSGHDGLQYFYLKYFVFSSNAADGEFPLWLPYVAHGMPSTWFAMLQSGIFDPIGLLVAKLFRLTDFFPIFYALLFAENVLLIVGTWLLASEHFKTRQAVFAATAAVSATTIWYTQPWFNFHGFVALPLMWFFLHRTLTAFRWVWVVALSLLFYLQTFGQPVYVLPMTLLFLAFYALVVIAHREDARPWRRFSFSAAGLLALAGVIAALALEMLWLQRSAAEDMSFGASGRGGGGSIPLSTFLTYAGNTDLRMWNQFFTSLTPNIDFTMFAGFLIAGLTLVTFCSGPLNRVQRIFLWLTLGVLLVCTASPLDTVIYYFWPLAGIFRHLSLLAPAAKLAVILLAAATFDRLLSETDRPQITLRTFLVPALGLGVWVVLLVMFEANRDRLQGFLAALGTDLMLRSYQTQDVGRRLAQGVVLLTVTMAVLFGLLRAAKRSGRMGIWGWAAAGVLLVDVAAYGVLEMRARSVALTRSEAPLFTLTPLPYVDRRIETPDATVNMRREMLRRVWRLDVGTTYWTENLLWHTDTYRSKWDSLYWSPALDQLLRTVSTSANPAPERSLPPADSRLLPLIAGLTASKTRLLPTAIICPDLVSTVRVLTSPAYRADVALMTGPASPDIEALPCDPAALPRETDVAGRPEASVQVVRFGANRAEFDVTNPHPKPAVLTYSDAWSERWQARINGAVTPVYRSDIAYKAVIVPPGKSRVFFDYQDPAAMRVFLVQTIGSLSFLVLSIGLAIRRQ